MGYYGYVMLIYFFSLKRISPPLNIYSELEKMLALRSLNWSYNELSEEFKVPKTTIRYLVRRFGLAGRFNPPSPPSHRSATSPPQPLLYNEETDSNYSNKSYKDYLDDERKRKWVRLTQRHSKSV